MAFQYPVEIAGVNNAYFLKAALNAKRKHHGQPELDAMEFMQLIKEKAKAARHRPGHADAPVNEGFSGGEKKRNEIFQMALLEPKLAILDETDSGLDIDALKIVAERRQRDAQPRARDHRRDPLPAAARLHRPRPRPRAERRPHREVRRQGAGAGARDEGLRLARARHRADVDRHGTVAEKLHPWVADGAAGRRSALAAGPARARRRDASPASGFRPFATRNGASPTSRRSPPANSGRRRSPRWTRRCSRPLPVRRRHCAAAGRRQRPVRAGSVAPDRAAARTCAPVRWPRRSTAIWRPTARSSSATSGSSPTSAAGRSRRSIPPSSRTAPSSTSPTGVVLEQPLQVLFVSAGEAVSDGEPPAQLIVARRAQPGAARRDLRRHGRRAVLRQCRDRDLRRRERRPRPLQGAGGERRGVPRRAACT